MIGCISRAERATGGGQSAARTGGPSAAGPSGAMSDLSLEKGTKIRKIINGTLTPVTSPMAAAAKRAEAVAH